MARASLKAVCRLIEQATEKLPSEQSFLADLKRSIEKTDEANTRAPSKSYKPSSMNCIRNMYYQVTGVTPDPASSNYCMVGICGSGTDTHARIQEAVLNMKVNGADCEYIDVAEFIKIRELDHLEVISKEGSETKVYHKNLNMRFMCDGIIKYNGRYYILEIKTEVSFKWGARQGVDESHYNQGTAYSVAFGIPDVLFLYISRDVHDMKAYMFTPSDELKQNLVGTITECDGYVSRMICPPKPQDVTKKTCQYCNYRTRCIGIDG